MAGQQAPEYGRSNKLWHPGTSEYALLIHRGYPGMTKTTRVKTLVLQGILVYPTMIKQNSRHLGMIKATTFGTLVLQSVYPTDTQ